MNTQRHLKKYALTTAAIVLTASLSTQSLNAAEFKLTAGSSHPPIVPWAAALRDLIVPESTKRAKALGHTLKWTEAYSGVLYNFKNTLEGIQDGLADVGWVAWIGDMNRKGLDGKQMFADLLALIKKYSK